MTVRGHTRPLAAIAAIGGVAAVLAACGSGGPSLLVGANPARGHALILRYGCGACHTIGGVEGANGKVGPLLTHFKDLRYIVGLLPRTPEDTARWIQHPQRYSPGSVMPDLGVTPAQARDIAAYLYTQ